MVVFIGEGDESSPLVGIIQGRYPDVEDIIKQGGEEMEFLENVTRTKYGPRNSISRGQGPPAAEEIPTFPHPPVKKWPTQELDQACSSERYERHHCLAPCRISPKPNPHLYCYFLGIECHNSPLHEPAHPTPRTRNTIIRLIAPRHGGPCTTWAPQYLDFNFQEDEDPSWDLPPLLRPQTQLATLPNANLLGWGLATQLTSYQRQTLVSLGFEEDIIPARNVDNFPLLIELLSHVSDHLLETKVTMKEFPSNQKGSLSQIPFTDRILEDTEPQTLIRISSKGGITRAPSNFSVHIANAAETCRFRIRRHINEQ
ncbi:hypothetical protein M8J76_000220 [Diaphorina citri]|nr:hypothetical protein M8J76_000220 [Diaphorina citri]